MALTASSRLEQSQMLTSARMWGCGAFFRIAGTVFLALAKAKHLLRGYTSPKPFDIHETARCISYDLTVVHEWLKHLETYAGDPVYIKDKRILELGPGSDLGVGLYLLARGCAEYNACDVNDLVRSTPDLFYDQFFQKLRSISSEFDIDALRAELHKNKTNVASRLNYVVRADFDLIAAFGEASVDLVLSQAAFEHFRDVRTTIKRLSAVCRPGAIIVAEIDLKTHSRWIRDKDPNNIYRFPDWFYRWFAFRGIPNRVRPYQYEGIFEECGWRDIRVVPIEVIGTEKGESEGLAKPFVDVRNQMRFLSIVLCARKG